MQTIAINHPKLRIRVLTGSEGPEHDPYSYEEFHITTPKGTTILHFGLGTWATHNKAQVKILGCTDSEGVKFLREDFLREITGYTLPQIERIARKRAERCRCCSGRIFEDVPGYPGEHFRMCSYCGEITDTYFCISEVE